MTSIITIERPAWSGNDYDDYDRARAARIVNGLSLPMQAALARHTEGPQIFGDGECQKPTIRALAGKGLLIYDRPNNPRCTTLSTLGRLAAAYVVAMEAEALATRIAP